MVQVALLQFILHDFLQGHIKWAILLNCWDVRTRLSIAQLMMEQYVYVQLRNVNDLQSEKDIERHYLLTDKPHVGVFLDINCNASLNVLEQVPNDSIFSIAFKFCFSHSFIIFQLSSDKLFKQQYHWLIYDETSNLEYLHQLFENYHMAVDADVSLGMPNPRWPNIDNNSTFIIYDVYNNGYNLGGKLNITEDRELLCSQMECAVTSYLSGLHEKLKYENRWSLRDITMRVAAVSITVPQNASVETKITHLLSMENMHIDGVARYGFQYTLIVQDVLKCKFTYNFTNFWSRDEVSGGAIGALGIANTVDLATSPLLSTRARFVYITPVMPLGKFRQVCLFRTPRNSGIQGDVFLKPFSTRVWIVFGMILTLTAVALWFIFFVENKKLKLYLNVLPSLLTTCLIAFGSACCQGSFLIPSSMGGRMTFICLSLLTFIIYNYYTSIVVAILLGTPVKSNIKTIDQLAASNLEVALEPQPYTRTFLNFSTLPGIRAFVHNKFESRKNPESIWLPVNEGLRRVRDEPGFVYGTDAFSGYSLVEQSFTAEEICDINEVALRPEQELFTHLHRNSSYREIIKIRQARIMETGIHRRLENIWVKNRLNCYQSSSFVMQVGLEYTAPLFIMLAGVFMLSLMLLLLEIQWRSFRILKRR